MELRPKLFDTHDRVAGPHGAGLSWQPADGGRVGGRFAARAAARVAAPNEPDIPWPRFSPQPAPAAAGTLAGASHIQRSHTRGGLAPASPCVHPPSVRVPCTANYLFFRSQA